MNISININTMSSDRPIPQKTRSPNPPPTKMIAKSPPKSTTRSLQQN
ncbi:hypothetical protein VB774_14015 [Pseudanabaena galeata UHCC 0370]|uniref:Uncharacterized protein n=1 Tax=Pseudanabaena galeata UHCC 0370 TaxID=3110310 RepID=A0ABU5TMF1_9CYAN|nr:MULTISPECIES: hypothetical protein [Pseudanabaena]MEA5478738.1 hypothetical protein [Pseudanabaena galeata UHCC 0370]MEA5485575.1 hypothetical protein [Pseudanabaena sp. CCNP1317]WGS70712.1 hypothetical protein OA858_13350 [Pseudanabaena galeata CCNP1313]